MRYAAVCLCTVTAFAVPMRFASSQATRGGDDLALAVPRILQQTHVASVSFAEIRDGRLVLAQAYGEQGAGVPATTSTLYNIASMTKPVSAEVVLRLVSQGRVSLDEPMYKYWTDPDIATDERRKLLTPRIALSHRTGFPNWRPQTGRKLSFQWTPGEKYGYSGEGYQYVARFVERKTGQPFEELAQKLVFDPAGMKSTAYTRRAWFAERIAAPSDASGKWLEPVIADKYVAADLIYSTPSDYARFVISLMNGEGESREVREQRDSVQFDRRAEMCTGKKAAGCPDAAGPGLGWEVIKVGKKTFLMHTGRDTGVFTLGFFDPDARSGVVMFTNGENGAQVVLPLLRLLMADPVFIAYLESQA